MAKRSPGRRLNVYSNLSYRRKTKKDGAARKKAEYLASLPKHPVKRFLYRLHPKRVAAYWFSKRGAFMALKITGVFVVLMILMMGALFAYFRKDLDQIRPGELAKSVRTTVTKYYDRNGKLLWEDKGDGNYTLTVDGKDISDYMKKATVAVEDKDFYKHGGVSISGTMRAVVNNASGDTVQGGSTLTQQLVKQVFFADEAQDRGLSGIPRKIKEAILAIEVERMYDKEQILNLYLNQSPYGGRRNGVESAARTYFGKSAKDLTLAEASLLAAIPQNPAIFNPYNRDGNEALIARQHVVLKDMREQGYITQKEMDGAMKVDLLDNIKPESDQYKDIRAPHFVQMVRSELESKLGKATVGRGGLIVKTTLDLDIQTKLEEQMNTMFSSYWPGYAGFSNGAGVVEDVKTGQIVALLGSRDFNYPGYGQDNSTTAYIQPGSTIKPFVYAKLFENKGGTAANYGSGSVLSDTRTTFGGSYTPQNADGGFRGYITIRNSLAWSRNIPAIKAMVVNGVDESLESIRAMGDKYYCTQGNEKQAGLSSAIGGCGTRMVDHVNALASLARLGVYKPHTSIIEVTNASGDVLEKYNDEQKKILDPQAAYVVNDILGDGQARNGLFGNTITPEMDAAGIKVAVKTGTSDIDKKPKDIWTVGYTPSLSAAIWLGNPTPQALANGNSSIPARVLDPVMAYATQLYQKQGKAKAGEWFTQPAGIQRIGKEVYPSWYNRKQATGNAKLTFDKVSKRKATDCTPAGARIEVSVTKITDPVTKRDMYLSPDGYDATKDDDVHKCSDAKPSINGISISGNTISVRVTKGTFALSNVSVQVNGQEVGTISASASGTYETRYAFTDDATVTATVTDAGFYTASGKPEAYKHHGNDD